MVSHISRITFICVGILVLVSISYKTSFPTDDPYRCRSVLETGRWIDLPDKHGDRLPFKNWQPDGCLFHNYTSIEIQQCVGSRSLLTSGDSTSRNLAFGIGRALNRTQAIGDREMYAGNHGNGAAANFTWNGVNVQTLWNPFLRTAGQSEEESRQTTVQEGLAEMLEPIRKSREDSMLDNRESLPVLLFFSSGAWYAKTEYAMEEQIQKYAVAVSNLSDIVGKQKSNFIVDPMDPVEGIGDQVFFAPPAGPWYQGNDTELMELKSGQGEVVVALQDWLHETNGDWNFPILWAIPKLFVGQLKTARNPDRTGWHAIEIVVEAKANILLNLRCNAKLDRLNGFPYNRTCCTDYGVKPFVQLSLVAVSIICLMACLVREVWDLLAPHQSPRTPFLHMNLGVFVLALIMCYYADRTQMMAKGAKLGSSREFGILCLISALAALATVRRSLPLALDPKTPAEEANQPFLGQTQLEEWKGWMLLVILIQHWTDAKSLFANSLVQTLICAYTFLTGYEHTAFFMITKDFSFNRVATVLLRLNLLACSLSYLMNSSYMSYYLAPLVSFWFMVVYVTMAIGHKSLNGDIQLLLSKICISAVIVGIMLATPPTWWIFSGLRAVCGIRWSVDEWENRMSVYLLPVYCGMMLAIAGSNINTTLKPTLRYSLALVSIVAIYGYAHASSMEQGSLGNYQTWPFDLSIIPIIGYVTIRNTSSLLKSYHSKAMSYIGQSYMEAYVLQFHLFLAADSYGILLIDTSIGDGTLADRWKSLVIIVPLFFWISYMTSSVIGSLVEIILGVTPKPEAISVVALHGLNASNEADDQAYDNESLLDAASTNGHFTQMGIASSREIVWSIYSILQTPYARFAFVLLIMWLLNYGTP